MEKPKLELGLRRIERLKWRAAAAKADLHRTIGRAAIADDLAKQRRIEDRRVRTRRLIALGGRVRYTDEGLDLSHLYVTKPIETIEELEANVLKATGAVQTHPNLAPAV